MNENKITSMPPHMLAELVDMIKSNEFCPDALAGAICYKNRKDPEFVQWMFRVFGGTYATDLAVRSIEFYKKNF